MRELERSRPRLVDLAGSGRRLRGWRARFPSVRGDGVETVTESDDPEVAAGIRKHVAGMARRLKEGRPIHARDPLFAEIFRHVDAIVLV